MSRRSASRLTDSSEFDRVYKSGEAFRGKLISVHAFPNDAGASRLGLSVSKKVGNAVVRNLLRRRLKEIFHSRAGDLPRDLDLVISARPGSSEASFEQLTGEFDKALARFQARI